MLSAEPPLAVSRSWAQYQRDQGQATLGSDQGRSLDSVFPVYGGDDGARIRDLCRDREQPLCFSTPYNAQRLAKYAEVVEDSLKCRLDCGLRIGLQRADNRSPTELACPPDC